MEKSKCKNLILAKIRRFITEKTAIKRYKCMIRPHLDYIDFVVESGSADRIQKVDTLKYCMVPENRQNLDVLMEKYKIECLRLRRCTKPLSTIQCNKTLGQDQLILYYS